MAHSASQIPEQDVRIKAMLSHIRLAKEIDLPYFQYETDLNYLYIMTILETGSVNPRMIEDMEKDLLNKKDDPYANQGNRMLYQLQLLSKLYAKTNKFPENFYYDMILEYQDYGAYFAKINKTRLAAIQYLQCTMPVDASIEKQLYFLNYQPEDHMKNPKKVSIENLLPQSSALVYIFKTKYAPDNNYIGVIYRKDGSQAFINLGLESELEPAEGKFKNDQEFQQLYLKYWKKIDDQLQQIDHIFLVADGIYKTINPYTLIDENQSYLIDRFKIDILTSIVDLYFEGYDLTASSNEAVLIGNPSYTLMDITPSQTQLLEYMRFNRGNDGNKWTTLPGTMSEVQSINQSLDNHAYNIHLVTQRDASEEYVRSISNPEILHIATHGFVAPDNVSHTNGLVFSGVNHTDSIDHAASNDGYLFAEDIAGLNLVGTRLVVLSACDTGVPADHAQDFRKAFFDAGVKNLLVSLWPIDDEATQDLLSRFYKNLAQTGKIRYSFQLAQDYMKEKYNDPYYWGSFILISSSPDTQLK